MDELASRILLSWALGFLQPLTVVLWETPSQKTKLSHTQIHDLQKWGGNKIEIIWFWTNSYVAVINKYHISEESLQMTLSLRRGSTGHSHLNKEATYRNAGKKKQLKVNVLSLDLLEWLFSLLLFPADVSPQSIYLTSAGQSILGLVSLILTCYTVVKSSVWTCIVRNTLWPKNSKKEDFNLITWPLKIQHINIKYCM